MLWDEEFDCIMVENTIAGSNLQAAADAAKTVMRIIRLMPNSEAIEHQQRLLAAYRETLAHFRLQRARLGADYAPPSITHGIHEARTEIRRIKDILHNWGIEVEDLPDDEDAPFVPETSVSLVLPPSLPQPSLPLASSKPISSPAPPQIPAIIDMPNLPTKEYEISGFARLSSSKVGLWMAIIGILSLLGGIATPDTDPAKYNFGIPFSIMLLIYGVFIMEISFRRRILRVNIFPDRIEYLQKGRIAIIGWNEILAVQFPKDKNILRLLRTNGPPIEFSHKSFKGLTKLITSEIQEYFLARSINTYNVGHPIAFGNLTVDQRGIHTGKELIPWNMIEGFNINNATDTILISERGKAAKQVIGITTEMPNAFIFLRLVNHILISYNKYNL